MKIISGVSLLTIGPCADPVYVSLVGVDDSSTNRLDSSVAERPACDGVVPGSIPGLAFSFSSYISVNN